MLTPAETASDSTLIRQFAGRDSRPLWTDGLRPQTPLRGLTPPPLRVAKGPAVQQLLSLHRGCQAADEDIGFEHMVDDRRGGCDG
jgi:hypothetical protein